VPIEIDGKQVDFSEGETILEVARREGVEIPTLCHDPRLKPAGACRTCLVEVEGARKMPPSCATKATDGMVVKTKTDRVRRHHKALLALYLADHVRDASQREPGPLSEVHAMAKDVGAPTDWTPMEPKRVGRDDPNPYIEFRADRCIACARCTRYCAEVESVSAISLIGRGADTTIGTVDAKSLLDTTCELCGGCIDTCPTGAMTERAPLLKLAPPDPELTKVRTTCNYCGVGCQMDLNVDPSTQQIVKVTSPPPGTPPNDGNLCVKGRFAYEFVHHPDRLTTPLVRGEDGELREASWDEALDRAAKGLKAVRDRRGADALGFVSSSRCTMEENYLVQKLSRAAFGTNNCHQCAAT